MPTATTQTTTFPRSTPEAQGIPASRHPSFIDAVEQHQHPLDAIQSFMLLRHGQCGGRGVVGALPA